MIKFFKQLFSHISPFVIYTISGRSMYPTFISGQKVLVQKKWFFCRYKTGDVIVFFDSAKRLQLIKRIQQLSKEKVYVQGDNGNESTDSRYFGWIDKKYTIGKVILS